MHLVGLVLGSVAPVRLRASGAAHLAAPGGHSLGEERRRGGEREREATGTDLDAGTGIFITPVISLLRARLRSFPSSAALCTIWPVRGGSLAVPGAGVCRREGMGESEGEEKPGGEERRPDSGRAHTGITHPSGSHKPHGHPPTRANAARNSATREQLSFPGAATKMGRRRRVFKTWK